MDREKLLKAWELFRDANPYEICDGREFKAIRELGYCLEQMVLDTIELLKEQEDCIEILTSDLEEVRKEHQQLLDKKIPLITNGQEVVRCKDCGFGEACKNGRGEHGVMCYNSQSASHGWVHEPDWFCGDGERDET